MKLKNVLIVIAVIALGLGVAVTGCSRNEVETATVGQPAPNFTLPDLDSDSVSLSDFKGRPVLVNFWRINCAPCLSEVGHLQAAYEKYDTEELALLTINVADGSGTIKQFHEDQSLSFPVLLDTEGKAIRSYAVSGVPTTFVIDADGIIRNKIIGPFSSLASIENQLQEVMP